MDCSKYIERAKNSKSGSVNWTLQLEKVQELVKEFKKAHPKVKYTIEQDWDDEEDYTVTFSWEPGSFGVVPVKVQEVVPVKVVQEAVPVKVVPVKVVPVKVQEVVPAKAVQEAVHVKKDVKVRYK
jgi:hypothetical protein